MVNKIPRSMIGDRIIAMGLNKLKADSNRPALIFQFHFCNFKLKFIYFKRITKDAKITIGYYQCQSINYN